MRVLNPVALTTPMVISSVAENDAPEWDATATYAAGQLVMKAATHRIYESVLGGNKGNDPTAAGTTQWLDTGPTNAWAMFDRAVGTDTIATGSIVLTLTPGTVSALAVLDTNAETVRVQMLVGGIAIYDRTMTANVSGGVIADWYDFFFSAIGRLDTLIFPDLPLYSTAQIVVTITGPDPNGPVDVGTLLVGTICELGSTEVGGSVGTLDFSVKTTDQFGVTDVVERPWSKQFQLKAMVDMSAVDGIQRTVAGLRAKPCLWIGEDGFDALAIYGFFKDFQIDLTLANIAYLSLTVEGLI